MQFHAAATGKQVSPPHLNGRAHSNGRGRGRGRGHDSRGPSDPRATAILARNGRSGGGST